MYATVVCTIFALLLLFLLLSSLSFICSSFIKTVVCHMVLDNATTEVVYLL